MEGGLTRLAAVFQSAYPATVGPVRSGRLTDIALVDNLNHPALAFAGANGLFLPQLRAQPIDDIDIDNKFGLFFVIGSRAAPHNIYTNVAADAADDKPAGPPPALFAYRAAGTPLTAAGTRPASQVDISWPATSVTWTFNAATGLWSRGQNGQPDVDSTGAPLTTTNIVVQAVPYITSAIADEPGPTPIPEGLLVGSGPAWIFSGGAVVQGTWARTGLSLVTTYTDAAGQPIALAPGRTWVELTQAGTIPAIH